MQSYTTLMQDHLWEIDPEDEDYEEKLVALTKEFKNFGELLEQYLKLHGFMDAEDTQPIPVLKQLFARADVKAPRNIEKWFDERKSVEKETAYQICFALGLNAEEVDLFFRKVFLDRAFDFHNIQNVVHYFAFSHGLSYTEAQELMQKVDAIPVSPKAGNEKFYTVALKAEIMKIRTEEDLMRFFCNHKAEYVGNNVTAFAEIQGLWQAISGENGLASREYQLYQSLTGGEGTLTRGKISTWDTFLMIFDFSKEGVRPVEENPNARTIVPILKQLNPLIYKNFPDRNGIGKVLNEAHNVEDDKVRKLLIFLTFYKSLAEAALKKNVETSLLNKANSYRMGNHDLDKYITIINKFLIDAGYPELYVGNPYDWLFCYLLCQEEPLCTFREFFLNLLTDYTDPEKKENKV